MALDFYQSRMGQEFFDGTMKGIEKNLASINGRLSNIAGCMEAIAEELCKKTVEETIPETCLSQYQKDGWKYKDSFTTSDGQVLVIVERRH